MIEYFVQLNFRNSLLEQTKYLLMGYHYFLFHLNEELNKGFFMIYYQNLFNFMLISDLNN